MVVEKPSRQVPVGNHDFTNTSVVIIGAGISGICVAIDLIKHNKCYNFIILEKGSGPGGTWRDNNYPGCCCDVWSHLYSYSFEPNTDWTRLYPGQEEILNYLIGIAQKYDLFKHIRFSSRVEEARWSETKNKWEVLIQSLNEKEAERHMQYTVETDFLISAVGQLNNPKYPDIPGMQSFTGKTMHSARWDWTYDLRNKKVAIIGSGCTAAQIAPEAAKVAAKLTIFQRSPPYVIPRGDVPVSKLRQNSYKYVPLFRKRVRANMMSLRETLHTAVADEHSPSSEFLLHMALDWMHKQLPNRPDLWDALTPSYPVGCKRTIVSDDYYPCLAKTNVNLETNSIKCFTNKGIQAGEEEHEFDAIILATGFQTTNFFQDSIEITGLQGRTLKSVWAKGPQALNGVFVEAMPNFAVMYGTRFPPQLAISAPEITTREGPNTNLGHNSIVLMIEAQSRYISTLVHEVLDSSAAGSPLIITPNRTRLENFNTELQETLKESSYANPACDSWFKNENGKITQNWSGTAVEYQKLLSAVDWNDFDLTGRKATELRSRRTHIGRVVEESWISYTTVAVSAAAAAACVGLALARKGFSFL